MNYNINFQVAAVIITALLLYHFLTQKKLHNANVKTFTYILVLSGLYILSDLLGTLTIMNYTAEDEGTVMGILTGIYLLDILIPYILYSCIPDSRENEKKSGALSVICAGITVAMMIAVLGNLGSGGFFCFDSNGVFQKGTGYVFLYLYALVYIVLIMQRMIRSREDYTPEKMSIAGEFLVIEGVCIGVELYTGYIFLSDFGLALGLIFLYLMMNNPGDYIDSTTGAFDKRYFDNWIQEKFTKGIEFHVIAVELFMLKQINKVYGSSTGDLLLVQIARELQNITGSVQVFRTTGNCFLIITDSLTEYEKKRQEIENYFKEPFETDGEKITFPAIICGIINGEKMEKEDVLALPMVYMFKEGFAEKVRAFVENGGTLITSYWSGIADDTDRCYLEGTPHGLMDVLGIRSTEIDGLYDWEENSFVPVAGNELGLDKTYTCKYLCDLVELRGARTLMTYGSDFYEGYSCLTVNEYGKGKAWYVAADADKEFYGDFLGKVLKDSGVSCGIKEEIPDALEITVRENENEKYYIYQNFGTEAVNIPVPEGQISWIYGNGSDKLEVYGLAVARVIV